MDTNKENAVGQQVFTAPSRAGLILGGVLVALHGFENEALMRARCFNDPNWNEHPDVLEARRIAATLRCGEKVRVDHERICDLLAHTQQVMRISHDEWGAVVGVITDADVQKPQGASRLGM